MQAPVLVPIPLKQLSKKYRGFIKEVVRCGDELEAFHLFYAESKGSKAKARKLRTKLAVYIDQELQDYIKGTDLAIMAVKVVADLAKDATSETVQLQAAKDILSRGGHDVEKEVTIKHETKDMSNEAIDKRLKELQDELFKSAPSLIVVPD